VIAAAEGNPLFLEQLVAMQAEDGDDIAVPPNLRALLAARVDSRLVHGSSRARRSTRLWLIGSTAAFVLVVLGLFSPVLGLIALLIRLDSPGPAVFTQRRVGEGGVAREPQLFLPQAEDTMRALSLSEPLKHVRLGLAALGELAGPLGMIARLREVVGQTA